MSGSAWIRTFERPTRGLWLLVGLGACACSHAATEGTVDSGSPSDSCLAGVLDDPPVIEQVTLTCDEILRTVTFDVQVRGRSDGADLYEVDAGSPDHWSDEVLLTWYRFDQCLDYTWSDAEIVTGVDRAQYREQINTPFRCDVEYADGDVTFAVHARAYDGTYGDCVAWGSAVDELVAGTLSGRRDPSFDVSRCRVVASPRDVR